MMGKGMRVLLAMLGVLALVAAACSSDDEGDVSTEATEEPAEEAAEEPTGAAADEPTEEAASEPTEAATEEAAEEPTPEELPASFRGVTSETIKVGVAVPDFAALQAGGIPNLHGDADVAYQAFFDIINAEGGIYGRQIEPVYEEFDFLEGVSQEQACTALTEDHEVFIVLYGVLGQNNLCFTELHDTMVMTRSFQTTSLAEASGDTLWVQLNATDDEAVLIMGGTLAASGRLDGKKIGILGRGTTEGSDAGALSEQLEGLGFETFVAITEAPQDDALARETEYGIIAQRMEAEGVEFVFELIGGAQVREIFAANGFTPEFAHKNLGAAVSGADDRANIDGSLGVGAIDEQSMWDDPDFWETCMQPVLDANPELAPEFEYLPNGDQQAAGEPNWLNPIMMACDHTMLLKELGEIAGADLTNAAFLSALDELGSIELNGYGQASYSSTKWDGLDEFWIQEYDAGADAIILGASIIIDRS
jgi:hypothetical protein